MTTMVVLQPGYLPWLGFFDQMRRCDIFVYYDDVQFDKNGWRNRNRIKTAQGPLWLTVPVLQAARMGQRICDVEVDQGRWTIKHLRAIAQSYAKAPYLQLYYPELEALLQRHWAKLVDLDLALTEAMCRWLRLERQIMRASELGISGAQSERLLNICRHFGADRYVSGAAAREYLDVGLFAAAGIEVEWQDYHHPVYPQLHGAFVPFMSSLDLLLNVGPDSLRVIAEGASPRG
jgi:hypothetical protein